MACAGPPRPCPSCRAVTPAVYAAMPLEISYRSLAPCSAPLERDVLVRRFARQHARLLEGVGIDWDVRLHGAHAAGVPVPARAADIIAAAEELHGLGDDIDRLTLLLILAHPLAPAQAAVDRHAPPLGQVLCAVLALRAPYGHVEVVGLVLPLAGLRVAPAAVARDAKAAHRRALAGGVRAQLRITGEVAGDDHPVDIARCHLARSFRVARSPRASLGAARMARPGRAGNWHRNIAVVLSRATGDRSQRSQDPLALRRRFVRPRRLRRLPRQRRCRSPAAEASRAAPADLAAP